ncbi:GNAT family N-acetyltransferase [Streptomyces sp. UG1]|uniref:GNAT family N-acetyltransferase n=1 Tax=Streptomyces sp. UG1 TaxID=3417652 RepID=UPI003CFAA7C3
MLPALCAAGRAPARQAGRRRSPLRVPPGHRLIIREAAEPVAEAVVSVEPDRTATLYWIETLPARRRCGLGRKLLSQALALLAEQGATEVALVVDDAPHSTPDSQAAARLFASFGFTLVDELWTYQYRHRRAHAAGHMSLRAALQTVAAPGGTTEPGTLRRALVRRP